MKTVSSTGLSIVSRRKFLQAASLASLAVAGSGLALAAETQVRRRMKNVNTTDLADAARLACRTMGNVFNEADRDIPFFASWVTPDVGLAWNPDHSEAHVPGRHLNGLLHAETAFGLKIPDDVIAKHERAAFFSYGGALPLPLNRKAITDAQPARFLPHNLREGFHALYALTRFRKSDRARELAEQSIQTIFELWNPASGWNRAKIEAKGLELIEWQGNFITGIARCIGPLVKFYEATKHGPALELALALKSKAMREYFLPDGSYDWERFGAHTHSTTCTMSSLAHLAQLTNDANLLDRVRLFFDNGLRAISDDLGWSIENTHPNNAVPDRGEVNNSGDILETALILGRHGYPQYSQFAERSLRGHILPSQLRDISFIKDNKPADGKLSLAQRHLGAFGFPTPYGHAPMEGGQISFNMDIVGGSTDSICYAHEYSSDFSKGTHRVHLLFDRETDALKITSPYPERPLEITLKNPGALWVRMPSWVEQEKLKVLAGETQLTPRFSNNYAFLPKPPVNVPIRFSFPLPTSELTLKHRTRDIRVRLKGDSVIAMQNFGADLTFFDEI